MRQLKNILGFLVLTLGLAVMGCTSPVAVAAQETTGDLSSLTLDGTASGYAFSAGTYSYSGITVPNATSSVTVTPTGSGAITVNGATVASGSVSDPISLTAGSAATITVVATEAGKAAKTYTLSVTRQSEPVTLAVGDSYGGGIVAYILQSGDAGYDATVQHGIIAATSDQGAAKWAVSSYQTTAVPAPGATGTAIGTGLASTDAIIAQNGAGATYAAGLARACADGGFSDWYLPSRDELYALHTNRAAIGNFDSTASAWYWSSSETTNSSYALGKSFYNGSNANGNKVNSWRVRAVRSF